MIGGVVSRRKFPFFFERDNHFRISCDRDEVVKYNVSKMEKSLRNCEIRITSCVQKEKEKKRTYRMSNKKNCLLFLYTEYIYIYA